MGKKIKKAGRTKESVIYSLKTCLKNRLPYTAVLISQPNMQKKYHALALFSGGLDSILAIKVIERQGLRVLGLHFVSPFFGNEDKISYWERTYDITLSACDVGTEYLRLLRSPAYGFGKTLNPCIDCKIFMLRRAMSLLPKYGADFLISGEIVGQRPMSQRKEALNIIKNESGVGDRLLRPLCAFSQELTFPEKIGLIEREKLPQISGRDRKIQLQLAAEFGIVEIPNAGGGCLLTEAERAKRYAPILTRFANPKTEDFTLTGCGRQFWFKNFCLTVGRNRADNALILQAVQKNDVLFSLQNIPGALGLLRCGQDFFEIDEEIVLAAARQTAWFSSKARGRVVTIVCRQNELQKTINISPEKSPCWQESSVDEIAAYKKTVHSVEHGGNFVRKNETDRENL